MRRALRNFGGRPRLTKLAQVLAKFGFHAPLLTSVVPARGVGAASFTRTGTAVTTVVDHEGAIRNCLVGEARFQRMRRVRNLVGDSTTLYPNPSIWGSAAGGTGSAATCTGGFTDPDGGTTAWRIQANRGAGDTSSDLSYWFCNAASSGPTVGSVWIKSNTGAAQRVALRYSGVIAAQVVTATTEWQRLSVSYDLGSTPVANSFAIGTRGVAVDLPDRVIDVLVWHPQLENVTGQSNQNPSEYVSVGAPKANELLYTDDFTNAYWAKQNSGTGVAPVVTPNAALNPTGSATNATQITLNRGAGNTLTDFSRIVATPGTFSGQMAGGVWVKGTAGQQIAFRHVAWSGYQTVIFDGTWQLVQGVETWASSNFEIANRGTASSTNSVTFLIYGPQLNLGATLGTYFPVGNVYPFHGACVDGVKYFDYENGNTVSSNVVTEAVGRSLDGYSVGWTSGASGAYYSTPDAPANRITSGDMTFRFRAAAVDWTPAGNQMVIAKRNSTPAWNLYVSVTAKPCVDVWDSGGGIHSFVPTISLSSADGAIAEVLATVDTDNGTGGSTCTFYTSVDGGATWQLHQVITIAGAFSGIRNTTDPVEIGGRALGTLDRFAGNIHLAQVFQGIVTNPNATTPAVNFNPREGWTENRLTYSADYTNGAWIKFGTSSITGTTQINLPADLDRVFEAVTMVVGERYMATWRGLTGTGTVVISVTDGVTPVSQTVTLSSTPTDYSLSITAAGTSGYVFAAYRNGTSATAVVIASVSLRRTTVAGQRTSSQYLPTTTAALRGWISSTGEQWTINGAATVLQRQAEGYLPEGASTNLVLQSSNFGTTWAVSGAATIAAAAAARCGDIALDLLSDADAGQAGALSQTPTFTGDAVKSVSLLVKKGTSTSAAVRLRDNTAGQNRLLAAITWSNEIPVVTMTTGSQERSPEALGGGIYRLFLASSSVTAANTHTLSVYPASDAALSVANTGNIYVGGVQAENATVASSLIPTTTAAVGRSRDTLEYARAGNLDNTAGTVLVWAGSSVPASLSDKVLLGNSATTTGRLVLQGSGGGISIHDGTTYSSAASGFTNDGTMRRLGAYWGAAGKVAGFESIPGTVGAFDGDMGVDASFAVSGYQAWSGPVRHVRVARAQLPYCDLDRARRAA